MKRLFFLALAAIAAVGANAQPTWAYPCTPDWTVAGGASLGTDVENTGCHMNTDANSYMEVWCYDGTDPSIAWLEDVTNYDPYTNIGIQTIAPVGNGNTVEDPDIVLTSDGFCMVVFIEVDGSDRYPAWALFEFAASMFTQIDEDYFDNTHDEANCPNIDINDSDEMVAVWENAGSLYGNQVTAYSSGGATWPATPLTILPASGGTNSYRQPDICIHHAGSEVVTVAYVEELTSFNNNRKLYIRQYTLANYTNGGGGATATSQRGNSLTAPDDYWSPRITSPNSSVSTCTADCGDDYALVVVMEDWGVEYRIQAYSEFETSTPNRDININGPASWDIACYKNLYPVIAWPDGGVMVAWMLEQVGAPGCGDVIADNICGGGGVTVGNPSTHIIVEYLEDGLAELNTDNTLSLFNKEIDQYEDFLWPSVSDGDNMSSGDSVLYASYHTGATDQLATKRQQFATLTMKKGQADLIPKSTDVYPNPFSEYIIIRLDDNTDVSGVRLMDVHGREYAVSFTVSASGFLSVRVDQPDKLPAGAYLLEVNRAVGTESFTAMRQ